jgi:hypothetical protein
LREVVVCRVSKREYFLEAIEGKGRNLTTLIQQPMSVERCIYIVYLRAVADVLAAVFAADPISGVPSPSITPIEPYPTYSHTSTGLKYIGK